jgi:hypothetical protein
VAGKTKKERRNAQGIRDLAGPPRHGAPGAARSQLLPAKTTLTSRTAWICLALIGINLFAFAPIRQNEFINYDDPQYVTENPHIVHGLTWKGLSWALGSGYAFNWHPLTWASHMLDIELFGFNPGPHHITS